MARRKRKRGGNKDAPGRQPIVPWRQRARDILRGLREWARERHGETIEAHLHERFGEAAETTPVADLENGFDEFVCAPGSAGDGRSIVRAFAEEAPDLLPEERESLPRWEKERARRVYLVDRCHTDRLELWDPVAGARLLVQLLEKMATGRAAAVQRGGVVVAVAAPWGQRHVALGHVEIYDDDEAIDLYRREVRGSGRLWNDLPPVVPTA